MSLSVLSIDNSLIILLMCRVLYLSCVGLSNSVKNESDEIVLGIFIIILFVFLLIFTTSYIILPTNHYAINFNIVTCNNSFVNIFFSIILTK